MSPLLFELQKFNANLIMEISNLAIYYLCFE